MSQQSTQNHHAMIAMVEWYNQFKDFSARAEQTETIKACALEAATFACKNCALAGFDPYSVMTDAYNFKEREKNV